MPVHKAIPFLIFLILVLIFEELPYSLPQWPHHFTYTGFPFLYILANTCYFLFFFFFK